MNKQEIRERMRMERERIPSAEREDASQRIVAGLLKNQAFIQSQVLFTYIPFRNEVNIRPFIEDAVKSGKTVLIPKADTEKRCLDLYRFDGWEHLKDGAYGIPEPVPELSRHMDGEGIDLVIVPGVAFDRKGGRIGYGGGYYDRFFAGLKDDSWRLGVCFSDQLIGHLPVEEWDVRMNEVITEKENVVIK